jgi:hypothetical protein
MSLIQFLLAVLLILLIAGLVHSAWVLLAIIVAIFFFVF